MDHKGPYPILIHPPLNDLNKKETKTPTWKQDVRRAKLTQPQMMHIQSEATVILLTWPDLDAPSGPKDGPPTPLVGLLLQQKPQFAINMHFLDIIPT